MEQSVLASRFSRGLRRRLRAYCRAVAEEADDVIHDAVALALDEIGARDGVTLRPDLVPGAVNAFLADAERTLPGLLALALHLDLEAGPEDAGEVAIAAHREVTWGRA